MRFVTDQARWVRRFSTSDGADAAPREGVRLVCLPHAGGSASSFAPLAAALRGRVDTVAIQYPGRQDRINEPSLGSVQEMAEAVLRSMDIGDDQPYALFGHSMGAAVAYEMATRLQTAGRPPVRLFLSGRRGPLVMRDERVHLLDNEGFVDELTRLGATDTAVLAVQEMRDLILPMVRNDYRAIETYRCVDPLTLTCPITVLIGDDDPYLTPDEAACWRAHTNADFAIHVFAGGHFYLQQHLTPVAEIIAADLMQGAGDAAHSSDPPPSDSATRQPKPRGS